MRLIVRLAALAVIVAALGGLSVHYDATEEERLPYPTATEINAEYDAHVGQETRVFGTIRSSNDAADRATIEVDSDAGCYELTVRNFDADVRRGGTVQVYGVLEADRTIDAHRVTVVNPSARSALYKYAVSAVGAALVLVVFFREWRFDTDSLVFEVRDDG